MRASGVALRIRADDVPLLPRVLELIEGGAVPGGTRGNAETHAHFTTFATSVAEPSKIAFSDAQTSGGLLISVAPGSLQTLERELQARSVFFAVIGEVLDGTGIYVE